MTANRHSLRPTIARIWRGRTTRARPTHTRAISTMSGSRR